jgi:hypothetical protein
MKDELLSKYLPTKEQLSRRLPERGFFFGLLCTLHNQYMKDIIAEVQMARYTVKKVPPEIKELRYQTHGWQSFKNTPYHSSKYF